MRHDQHVGRVTASVINLCIRHVTARDASGITGAVHSTACSVMGYYEKPKVKCLQYGHENEPKVRLQYYKCSKQCHSHFDCEETGLHVSASHPFMAASPDSRFKIQIHTFIKITRFQHGLLHWYWL